MRLVVTVLNSSGTFEKRFRSPNSATTKHPESVFTDLKGD